MKIKMTTTDEPDHENLAQLFNLAVAVQLKESLKNAGLEQDEAWPIVTANVFDLAMLFDQGTFKINGKEYKPRIAFMTEDGKLLEGAAEFDYLHDYATIFEEDLEETHDFSIRV